MPDSNVLSQGIEFYNQKKYSDALTFFLALSSETGADSLDVAYYLGLCYAKLSRYEDSLLYLEQVVTAGKDEERVLQSRLILAVIYSLSGRKRLAAFEMNKLLEAEYKPASVYAALAFVAWEQSDTKKCLDYYEKSLDADPENVTALNGMGYVLACEDKDLTKALSFCKKAVKASPNSAACLDSLGWVYYKLGLYDDAKKYLEMAEAIDGNSEEIANHIKSVVLDGDKR